MANPIVKNLRQLIKQVKGFGKFDEGVEEIEGKIAELEACNAGLGKQIADNQLEIGKLVLAKKGLIMQKKAAINQFNDTLGSLEVAD